MKDIPVVDYDPTEDVPDLTFVLSSSMAGPPMQQPGETAEHYQNTLREYEVGKPSAPVPRRFNYDPNGGNVPYTPVKTPVRNRNAELAGQPFAKPSVK